jgi:hypothetical protein
MDKFDIQINSQLATDLVTKISLKHLVVGDTVTLEEYAELISNKKSNIDIMTESYQDQKHQTIKLESHQDPKHVTVQLESHQDPKHMPIQLESYQDPKHSKIQLESYQDNKFNNIKVESAQTQEFSIHPKTVYTQTQGTTDPNTQQVVEKLFKGNVVRVLCTYTDTYGDIATRSANGVFLKGRTLLVNRHIYENSDKIGIIEVAQLGNVIVPVVVKSAKPVLRNGQPTDFMQIECGNSINSRSDITTFFPSRAELTNTHGFVANGYIQLLSTLYTEKFRCHVPYVYGAKFNRIAKAVDASNSEGTIFTTLMAIEYEAQTKNGDCGAPLVLYNPKSRPKIVGLHVGGGLGTGYSQVFCKEDFNIINQVTVKPPTVNCQSMSASAVPNTQYLGDVAPVSGATTTKIVGSPLYGLFEVKKAPAVLKRRDVDILGKNIQKIGKPTMALREDLLDMCQFQISNVLSVKTKDQHKRVLTHEESITGIEGVDYISGINRTTSPGYPYVLRNPGKGKEHWLGSGEYITDNPELLEHIERIISDGKQNIVDQNDGIFVASLKDERRTLDKVENLKTRVFAAANMGLSLATRRYFLGFMKHVMEGRIYNEIGLGMNVYGTDWKNVASSLQGTSPYIIAGDFSNFDGSLNSQILFRIIDVVNDWYQDGTENSNVRRCLATHLFNAVLLTEGHLIGCNHSQPSGNPLTTLINCMYNMFIFRYCYLLALEANNKSVTLMNYNVHTTAVYYGDDSIMAISPSIISWFNQETISEFMATTGHDYTDETKSTTFQPYKDLSTVNFLKRGFNQIDGLWVAPLSTETLEDMVMWSKNNLPPSEALDQTIRTATVEAALHGKVYHQEYTSKVRDACSSLGYRFSGVSYQEALNFILEQSKMIDLKFGFF